MVAGAFTSYDVVHQFEGSESIAGWETDEAYKGIQWFGFSGTFGVNVGARRFSRGRVNADGLNVRYTIKDTIDGGRYADMPTGSKVVVDCSVRTWSSGQNSSSFWMGVKQRRTYGTGSAPQQNSAGYHLRWNQLQASATPTVNFWKRVGENGGDAAGVASSNLGSPAHNVFSRWRLTVEDNAGDDDITVEEDISATLDGTSWVSRHTETILSTDTHYVPWADATHDGIGFGVRDVNTSFGTAGQSLIVAYRFRVTVE